VAEETAAAISTEDDPMDTPGRPFNWRAPFFVAFAATFEIAVAYGIDPVVLIAGNVFIPIRLALFLAVGMEPAYSAPGMLITAAAVIACNVPATSGSACNDRANSLNCPATPADRTSPLLFGPLDSAAG